jgi:prepilin signal peptidase PulO-like enzyme (type II secretory pathway)
MAMIGAFLGVRLTILTLFAATLTGSLFGIGTMLAVWVKRTRRRVARNHEAAQQARRRAWKSALLVYRFYQMPFGVFLGSMALVAFLFGNQFLRWYWGLT